MQRIYKLKKEKKETTAPVGTFSCSAEQRRKFTACVKVQSMAMRPIGHHNAKHVKANSLLLEQNRNRNKTVFYDCWFQIRLLAWWRWFTGKSQQCCMTVTKHTRSDTSKSFSISNLITQLLWFSSAYPASWKYQTNCRALQVQTRVEVSFSHFENENACAVANEFSPHTATNLFSNRSGRPTAPRLYNRNLSKVCPRFPWEFTRYTSSRFRLLDIKKMFHGLILRVTSQKYRCQSIERLSFLQAFNCRSWSP